MINVAIDGVRDELFGLYCTEKPNIPTAKQTITSTSVPGRTHGNLTKKEGWNDINIVVSFSLYSFENLNQKIRRAKSWMFDGQEITFSDDPGMYYKIKSVDIGDIAIAVETVGTFQVTFTCDPFCYQRTGVMTFYGEFDIHNPSMLPSEPLWDFFGYGNISMEVNDQSYMMTDLSGHLTVDSQNLMVYRDLTNLDENLTGEFPKLEPGDNHVKITSGSVNQIKINPRWCYL